MVYLDNDFVLFDICLCDNTRHAKTVASLSRDLLIYHKIVKLSWPARSPDLVPINIVRDLLGYNIRYHNHVRTLSSNNHVLCCEWEAIPLNDFKIIIGLMHSQCTACM